METLTSLQNPYLSITNSFPLNPKSPILSYRNYNIARISLRTWKLHAEAKGFGNNTKLDAPERSNTRPSSINNNNDDDNDDKIPTEVWDRIIGRIMIYVGAPLALGFVFLQVFSVVKENQLWDVPVWLPFLTTLITFGASALGIAYGTLSASWDVEKQGSFLGFEEAQKNWVDMWAAEDSAEDAADEEENRWID